MKKLIILSLIITSLFIISCKGSGGGSDSSGSSTPAPVATPTPAATPTTPLEGKWGQTLNDSVDLGGGMTISISGSNSLIFAGTAITMAESVTMTTTDTSTSTSTTATLNLTIVGTFRLDGNNLYTTLRTASLSDGSTTITNISDIEAAYGEPLPVQVDNTEHLYGTYAVNGNTLTITPTGESAQNFTKQ